MRIRRSLAGLLLLFAATGQAGTINLRWTDCWGDGGVANRNFACDQNTGSNQLIGSFVSPTDVHEVLSLEIVVDLAVAGGSLPPWWQFRTTGACRQNSLTISMVPPPTAFSCEDWSQGQAVPAIGSFLVDIFGPGSARVNAIGAVATASAAEIMAGQEYYAFTLTISNQKTVGTGACAGCELGACIALKGIKLVTPVPANDRTLGNDPSDDRLATWQAGAGVVSRTRPSSLNCYLATPTRTSTWGSVKALYR